SVRGPGISRRRRGPTLVRLPRISAAARAPPAHVEGQIVHRRRVVTRIAQPAASMSDHLHCGRLLTRREAIATLGAGALAFWSIAHERAAAAQVSAGCIATPDQTEGPFFVDERLNRSDVRPDPRTGAVSEGAALTLALNVHAIAARG